MVTVKRGQQNHLYAQVHKRKLGGESAAHACKELGVFPAAYYSWLRRHPEGDGNAPRKHNKTGRHKKAAQTIVVPEKSERVLFFSGTIAQLEALKEVFRVG